MTPVHSGALAPCCCIQNCWFLSMLILPHALGLPQQDILSVCKLLEAFCDLSSPVNLVFSEWKDNCQDGWICCNQPRCWWLTMALNSPVLSLKLSCSPNTRDFTWFREIRISAWDNHDKGTLEPVTSTPFAHLTQINQITIWIMSCIIHVDYTTHIQDY